MTQATAVSAIDAAFRSEWSRLLATLVRELRDLELAEDVAQEAFVEASTRWRKDGVPDSPGAWLLTTARRKAIDRIRRAKRFDDRLPILAEAAGRQPAPQVLVDDQLALLFGCCHPALAVEAQVALTLRSVGGLSTAQIANAFLVPEATMAKRLVRAKRKIKAAAIPFALPDKANLNERLDAVCGVVYAIFTEGHTSTKGASLLRGSLCDEAIWLAETLARLAPGEAEVRGLAALCLLSDARRAARTTPDGTPVLLADQNRGLWNQDKIRRGLAHLVAAGTQHRAGPYRLQATVAAIHATAEGFGQTDWAAIVAVYDRMLAAGGGPVVQLNRAAAVAERDGAADGLSLLDEMATEGHLDHYHYFHSARAELLRRLGRIEEAKVAYRQALEVCNNDTELAWLTARLNQAGQTSAR